MSQIDIFSFIRELISDNDKLSKFKDIVSAIKELIFDIKSVINIVKK